MFAFVNDFFQSFSFDSRPPVKRPICKKGKLKAPHRCEVLIEIFSPTNWNLSSINIFIYAKSSIKLVNNIKAARHIGNIITNTAILLF
jgi:hypothetical protein